MNFEARKITPIRSPQEWRDNSNMSNKQNQSPRHSQKKANPKLWKRFLVLLVVVLIVISLFTYILPIVEITIIPKTTPQKYDSEIKLDTQISKWDEDNKILPAKNIILEKSTTGTFPATGEKDMGDKASGLATFYNQTGLTQPITVNTELTYTDGQKFVPLENLVVPQATVSPGGEIVYGQITVQIEALKAGDKGNVQPGKLTINDLDTEKQTKIYAQIIQPLSGGTSKIVKVVSQEDINIAQEDLSDQIKTKLIEEITELAGVQYNPEEQLINWEILSSEQSVELDKETQDFEIRIVLQANALIYDRQELAEIIKTKIIQQLPGGTKIVDSLNNQINTEIVDKTDDNTWADIKIQAEFQSANNIDIPTLKTQIAGKNKSEARRILLQDQNIRDVRFNFKYSLTSSIPQNINRIKILLKS